MCSERDETEIPWRVVSFPFNLTDQDGDGDAYLESSASLESGDEGEIGVKPNLANDDGGDDGPKCGASSSESARTRLAGVRFEGCD